MGAPPVNPQPPSFPDKRDIRFGELSHQGNMTVLKAEVKWNGVPYTITWRGAGQLNLAQAQGEFLKKIDHVYALHVRYMQETPEVTRMIVNTEGGQERIIRFNAGQQPTAKYEKRVPYYTPAKQQKVDTLKQEVQNLKAEITHAEGLNPKDELNIALLKARSVDLEAKLTRKEGHLKQRQLAHDLMMKLYHPGAQPPPASGQPPPAGAKPPSAKRHAQAGKPLPPRPKKNASAAGGPPPLPPRPKQPQAQPATRLPLVDEEPLAPPPVNPELEEIRGNVFDIARRLDSERDE